MRVEGESRERARRARSLYVTAAAPFGPWASDAGVTYANGTALAAVAGIRPPDSIMYRAGAYTFAAADAGAGVLISYGFIPAAINNACIEWVAERYRYRTRIGQSAQTVQGQQTASYSLKDMPDFIRASLDPYRSVVGRLMLHVGLSDGCQRRARADARAACAALESRAGDARRRAASQVQQKLSGGVLNAKSGALVRSIVVTIDEFIRRRFRMHRHVRRRRNTPPSTNSAAPSRRTRSFRTRPGRSPSPWAASSFAARVTFRR